jgi:hypothetical protein
MDLVATPNPMAAKQSSTCKEMKMENVLALQSLMSVADPLDDEMCWSTCSSSGCSSSSVFIPDAGCVDNQG